MTEFALSVRELVAFCHRSGDIDHRYTPSPSAEQGREGHSRIYRRRPASYQREYSVDYRHRRGDIALHLRGRADGYDAGQGLVEEIKTCRVDPERIPRAVSRLHQAQGRIYAALIARAENLPGLEVRLTWLNIDTDEEHSLSRAFTRAELEAFLADTLDSFAGWLQELARLRRQRDQSLGALAFPHGSFRPGQREIAELVYKCIDQAGQLMVEAPTGIGKTAAVLYPALKALATGRHDALVFVTSRTVGRRAAEDALALMAGQGMCATSLSLTAKESICFSPGKACHGDDCSFARGYYDRLPDAMAAALAEGALRREELEVIAREHQVCPYQLAADLLPWVDVVIADAHYVYSFSAAVRQLMARGERRWTVLLDEAHNLSERARGMYSARLAKRELMAVKRLAPAALKRQLERVNRALLALQREIWEETDFDSRETLPAALVNALADFSAGVGEAMAGDPRFAPAHRRLMDFYFATLQWLRVAEHWGEEYRLELARGEGPQGLSLELNCLAPARLLEQCHRQAHALVVFSATLSPPDWQRRLLGVADAAVWCRLPSPFEPGQLQVELETGIDTRYRQREASAGQLAGRLLGFLADAPGNTMLCFPSYRFLRSTLAAMRDLDPALSGRRLWEQRPGQDAAARDSLFTALAGDCDIAAFCILGGVFSEGVDLPGELLRNMVVVGVGLPQVGRNREQLRQWYQVRNRQGFEYAYLYPAMQKVDQALGRVVRTASDRGRALLVDSRYAWPVYRQLLPPWWHYRDS